MDDRKLKILAIVVDEYIKTGEPVGSKVISNHPDIKVSSATVRNDMATLEQLGYLIQPHTSAGRVPTYSGFRLYIDKLMTVQELTVEERTRLDKSLEEQETLTEDSIIEYATQTLAELTQCAVVVANSAPKFSVISKVEIIPTGKRLYVILLITSNGTIKNRVCRLEFDLTNEQMEFFSKYIQENLQGEVIENLSDEKMEQLVTALGTYMMTLTPLVQGIYEMSKDLRHDEYTVQGEKNLLACKDFDKMDIVNFLENKNRFSAMLDDAFSGIQIKFGQESSDDFIISNSSMIMSHYKKGSKTAGSLGIIGPMRLNYARIIPYIEYFSQKITDMITDQDADARKEDGSDGN
ncbi:MAG: heat-inducible transcriptional repressor HrcA [Ruminococcus sp.]|nr:heat-inducible transcriptional repressor HrcA [Ruminococcus sp.]MCD7801098.1 heat-inducible transcriptional repressor HrcA [Ruminococcus sp.]